LIRLFETLSDLRTTAHAHSQQIKKGGKIRFGQVSSGEDDAELMNDYDFMIK